MAIFIVHFVEISFMLSRTLKKPDDASFLVPASLPVCSRRMDNIFSCSAMQPFARISPHSFPAAEP